MHANEGTLITFNGNEINTHSIKAFCPFQLILAPFSSFPRLTKIGAVGRTRMLHFSEADPVKISNKVSEVEYIKFSSLFPVRRASDMWS